MPILAVLAVSVLVRADRAAGVFTTREDPSFTLSDQVEGARWTLRDVECNVMDEGAWPVSGRLTFPGLDKGYYRLSAVTKAGKSDLTFCRVADPSERVYPKDSFYGTDAALSEVCAPANYSCNWYGTNVYAAVLDLIRKAGLVHVRERLHGPDIAAGRLSPYVENARLADERGLDLSPLDHRAIPAMHPDRNCPTDLAAVHAFAAQVGSMYGTALGCYEFWNEPDIDFWPLPVWDYAAALKAAYLGLKSSRPDVPVLNGAVCTGARTAFNRALFDNDLAKYSNVFNLHLYGAPSGLAGTFEAFADLFARNGIGNRQAWVTESSVNIEGESVADGTMAGKKAHSVEQELVLAEVYPKIRALMQMGGIARDYCFVFGPYNERNNAKDWGIQRRDGSVKPIYAAIATMTEHLGDARIVGERKVGDEARCYVFQRPDGTFSLLYWAVSPCDTAKGREERVEQTQWKPVSAVIRIPVRSGAYSGASAFGAPRRHEPVNGELKLVAGRYAQYVDGLPEVGVDTRPIRSAGVVETYEPAADEDLSIVLRAELDPADFGITDRKTAAEPKGASGKARLQVWNLSRAQKRGRILVEGPEAGGADREFTVGPMSVVTLPLVLRFGKGGEPVSRAVFGGMFDGKRISRLVVPLKTGSTPSTGNAPIEIKSFYDPKAWERNDSGRETKVSWDDAEQALRFDCTWADSEANRWFYPRHVLSDSERKLIAGGEHLVFEVKIAQNKMENDVKEAYVMFVYPEGRKPVWKSYGHPIGNWERRFVEIRDHDGSALPSDLKLISIGCNPQGSRMTLWIRNIRVQ